MNEFSYAFQPYPYPMKYQHQQPQKPAEKSSVGQLLQGAGYGAMMAPNTAVSGGEMSDDMMPAAGASSDADLVAFAAAEAARIKRLKERLKNQQRRRSETLARGYVDMYATQPIADDFSTLGNMRETMKSEPFQGAATLAGMAYALGANPVQSARLGKQVYQQIKADNEMRLTPDESQLMLRLINQNQPRIVADSVQAVAQTGMENTPEARRKSMADQLDESYQHIRFLENQLYIQELKQKNSQAKQAEIERLRQQHAYELVHPAEFKEWMMNDVTVPESSYTFDDLTNGRVPENQRDAVKNAVHLKDQKFMQDEVKRFLINMGYNPNDMATVPENAVAAAVKKFYFQRNRFLNKRAEPDRSPFERAKRRLLGDEIM